jgi:hypothetical protein
MIGSSEILGHLFHDHEILDDCLITSEVILHLELYHIIGEEVRTDRFFDIVMIALVLVADLDHAKSGVLRYGSRFRIPDQQTALLCYLIFDIIKKGGQILIRGLK